MSDAPQTDAPKVSSRFSKKFDLPPVSASLPDIAPPGIKSSVAPTTQAANGQLAQNSRRKKLALQIKMNKT